MNYTAAEWLNLIARWVHVFASILWVGQTFFFTWLDGRFSEEENLCLKAEATGSREPPQILAEGNEQDPERKRRLRVGPLGIQGVPGSNNEPPRSPVVALGWAERPPHADQVWMVHSGGFYVIEKQKLGRQVPPKLRWFKWEAAITWLSGLVLLILVYYMGGLMVDASATTSSGRAIGIGVAVLIVGWVVYDGVWMSPLGRSEMAATAILYALVVLVSYGLCQLMSGRAAYIHVGGLFGTIMTANVWMRILPAQRRMIQAVAEGRAPDERLALQAKLRSKHNTFMVVPVVFIMVSNHFPVATYGNRYNWLILSALILAGWGATKHLRRA